MREYWRNNHRNHAYLYVFASQRRQCIGAPSDISVRVYTSFGGGIKPVICQLMPWRRQKINDFLSSIHECFNHPYCIYVGRSVKMLI